MNRSFHIKYVLIPLSLLVLSCSTRKDAFLNRKWHSLNSEYNVLYNGNNALTKGRQTLIDTYTDNYWELLPVERLNIREEVLLPGTEVNPDFERAEEKAVKAIQKHGMNIKGEEKNPQIDEAYLLLGKARYYDQRFVPALEAFNYILYRYSDSDIINQAKIWREKTNIRMENDELALKNLKRLLRQEKLNDRDYADANAMMGQAYINLKYRDSAVQKLKIAAYATDDNEQKGRYYYIIGQLFNELGYKDSAMIAFDKVIGLNRKTPRVYLMNAYVEKIRNTEVTDDNRSEIEELLASLEKNRENRPYLDKIYRENALYLLKQDSLAGAEDYFNRSLRTNSTDNILRSLDYEDLGKLKFDASLFKEAGAYYDSTLVLLPEKSKKFRLLSKKRATLADVIKYEDIVKRDDSLLHILSMSDNERKEYFQSYIDSIIEKEETARQLKELQALQNKGVASVGANKNSGGSTFYFYNKTSVSYGINEFRRIWGNRKLEDNWRWADRSVVNIQNAAVVQNDTESSDKYKADYYLSQLPPTESLDSISNDRNFANYQLGIIYKERFREYELAADRLGSVLNNHPEERLILPAKYNLYKIYEILGSPLAQQMKDDIINEHAGSRYAELILNPQVVLAEDENAPDKLYETLFALFNQQHYDEVITRCEAYANRFNGEEIASKFEMLKATATARLEGIDAYEQQLKELALNHPDAPEGKEAENIIASVIPGLKQLAFETDPMKSDSWKLVFPIRRTDSVSKEKLLTTLKRSLEELNYNKLEVSEDVFDKDYIFAVVHGLASEQRAMGFAELLKINKNYLINNENFVISSANYRIIQIQKNLDVYLALIKNPNLNN